MLENQNSRKRSSLPRRVSSMIEHVTPPDERMTLEEQESNGNDDGDIASSNDGFIDRKRHKSHHNHYHVNSNVNCSLDRHSIILSVSPITTTPLFHATITPVSSQLALDQVVVPAAATTCVSPRIMYVPHTTLSKDSDDAESLPSLWNIAVRSPTATPSSSSSSSLQEFVSTPRHRVSYHRQHHSSWWMVVLLSVMVAVVSRFGPLPPILTSSHRIPQQLQQQQPDTVCVSGGGFSGFWFTLGRLQNSIIRPTITPIRNLTNSHKEYYCYSSGCLGVVAALSRYSMEDMWNIAHNIQQQWKSGKLDRYDVVTTFVDVLLFGRPQQATQQQVHEYRNDTISPIRLGPSDLSTLNIITTVKNGGWGVKVSIRTPNSVQELRTMLIQTTWIPLAIGNDLWYDHHMDGAFTTSYHPKCQYQVGLAFDWDLYANVINVNLGRDKVEKFWNQGLEYGL